jgi:hypothetical protein
MALFDPKSEARRQYKLKGLADALTVGSSPWPPRLRLNDAVTDCKPYDISERLQFQFAHYRCTMSFHGFDAEVRSRRDGLIAIPLSEQLNNLALTRGQALCANPLLNRPPSEKSV